MRLLLICAAATALGACHASWEKDGGHAAQPSGPVTARTYDATGFTGVELEGSDDVQVRYADNFSVRAEGQAAVLDRLEIRVVGSTLKIGRKDHDHWQWNGDDHGARITVTLPRLVAASVGGSGTMDVDRAEGDFSGAVGGSGDLKVAQLKGGAIDLSIGGSGNVTVAGTGASLKAETAGSGDIDAKGLTVSSANVSVAGSGSVRGTVNGEADVSIAGSGDVDLGGGAHCKVSTVGSGDAHCG
jgi:hypothetical protein